MLLDGNALHLKAVSSPQFLGPKNTMEKRAIIQETLVMSVDIVIIKHTEKVRFL